MRFLMIGTSVGLIRYEGSRRSPPGLVPVMIFPFDWFNCCRLDRGPQIRVLCTQSRSFLQDVRRQRVLHISPRSKRLPGATGGRFSFQGESPTISSGFLSRRKGLVVFKATYAADKPQSPLTIVGRRSVQALLGWLVVEVAGDGESYGFPY